MTASNQSALHLVLYYPESNRYSFNVLTGAIECSEISKNINISFIKDESGLLNFLKNSSEEKIIVCFSFFTTQLWDIERILKKIKNQQKNIITIAGGPHPTGDPYGTLNLGFDIVVRGEGEKTFIELLTKIVHRENLERVEGIAFKTPEGKLSETPPPKPVELDNYPPFAVIHRKFNPIEITRGCPYACFYCQTSFIFGKTPRHRSVDSICFYVEVLKRRNIKDIRFISPNALSYGSTDGFKPNLYALVKLLESVRKILGKEGRIFFGSFPSEVRPDHITYETIAILKEYTDNDNLVIGAQSGSQRILDKSHRGHSIEDIYKAVDITLQAGYKANVDFILGLPYEEEQDIDKTLKVIKDLIKLGARIHLHCFIPLPQTPFWKFPPGNIKQPIKKYLLTLTSKKVAYGEWLKQEKIGEKINRYFQNRIL